LKPPDDYIDLHYDTLQDIIPNFYKSRLLNKLLQRGILERITIDQIKMETIDGGKYYLEAERGLERRRAYGYRLANPDYRNSKWTLRDLTKSSLLSKIKKHINCKYPVQRWLIANNSRLQVKETAPDDKALQLIRDKRWNNKFDCFGGRYYNNVTNLKKELRKFLLVDGESLCEIDIACSQLLFLSIEARKAGIEGAENFIKDCEKDLYQRIAIEAGLSREEVKRDLTQRALFSSNHSIYQRSKTKKTFDRLYPQISQWLKVKKYGRKKSKDDKPHAKLARLAQKTEARFVIHTVCERLRKENMGMFSLTIHDSILCKIADKEYVVTILLSPR
jgi:hypothetical protein